MDGLTFAVAAGATPAAPADPVDSRGRGEHDRVVTSDEVLSRMLAVERQVAERLGFPVIEGRSAVEGIRLFLEREARQMGEVEAPVSLPDPGIQRVFLALCGRYGVTVYKRPRQRGGNVTVRAPRTFIKDGLEPLFQGMGDVFRDWYIAQTEAVLARFERS